MSMKKIGIFLFDGYSDWEISYLTPEVYREKQYELIYFSEDGDVVTSMGGLQIKPTTSLSRLNAGEIDCLVLPGGTAWEKREITTIEKLVTDLFKNGKTIAAICGATVYLGQLGILDHLNHTSNDLEYLKTVAPEYKGSKNYQDKLAETGRNIITAKGIAPIEFACEIFREIGLKSEAEIEKWFQLFKNGIWSE